jgi:16S rRNA (cytosine1402-N4)-methyltransferase
MEERGHLPVLLAEVIQYLDCRPGRIYVDGTLGGGGHGREILERSSPTGRLIGLDWDEEAVERARKNLGAFGDRAVLRKENFRNLPCLLKTLSIAAVDGILLDLGVSTEQLESPERGFSYRWDAPLDMRMNRERPITAQEIVMSLSPADLEALLREYGEERWARRIARNIFLRRRTSPIRTTGDLVKTIEQSVPGSRGRIHPATRTFQALRIRVNEELANLQAFLEAAPDLLRSGGRLCIISYHSLEDRIVKNHFRRWTRGGRGEEKPFALLTPKPVAPSGEEVFRNPRARSAKLRAVEKN